MYRSLATSLIAFTCLLLLPLTAVAQLPSPTYGWNLGNTLEAPGGEGTWAPPATQELINAVAASGFNTIRIPIAWNSHANQSTYQINAAWLARVKEVVDWCYAANLTVIINSHWDNGWLDDALDGNVDPSVNARMHAYWTQIANTFANYDSKLLFAGANEPPADTAAKMSELMVYYQTFVNAVRATGGNNSTRWLVLSGPYTNIDLTDELMNTLPDDPTPGRLVVEVHDYAPYQFTLMTSDASWGKMFYFWGQGYHHPTRLDRNATWGQEDYIVAQYQKMKTKFVDQGVPVLLGEFGTGRRTGYSDLTGADYNLHLASRTYWNKTLVDAANAMGLRPVYWDNGWAGSNGFAVYDRISSAVIDQASITSLTGGPALPPPGSGGGCTASTVSVSAIAVTTVGGGNKRGQAQVTIVNNCGSPVANATVTGNFNGTISQSGVSAVTNASGVATLQTSGTAKGKVNITFCVTGVTASGLTYNSNANVETCDSN
jgi:endoglucanase